MFEFAEKSGGWGSRKYIVNLTFLVWSIRHPLFRYFYNGIFVGSAVVDITALFGLFDPDSDSSELLGLQVKTASFCTKVKPLRCIVLPLLPIAYNLMLHCKYFQKKVIYV